MNPGERRSNKHQRIEFSVGCGHDHDDALHACDNGGDCVHQHRARIAGCTARHVKPHRFDGRPAGPQFDADIVGVAAVLRQLFLMMGADAVTGKRQRFECPGIGLRQGFMYLVFGYPQLLRANRNTVEAVGVFDKGFITARADGRHNTAHRLIDIGGRFPLHAEQVFEDGGKIGLAAIQSQNHMLPRSAGLFVVRFGACLPGGSHVGQLGLDAFDAKPQGRAAGKGQFDDTGRRRLFGKCDRQQIQHCFLIGAIDTKRRDLFHALEMQNRTAALETPLAGLGLFPDKPVHGDHQPLFGWQKTDVAGLHHRILAMGGDDCEVFGVEGYEFQALHGRCLDELQIAASKQEGAMEIPLK